MAALAEGGGVLSGADLAAHRTVFPDPISTTYRGHKVRLFLQVSEGSRLWKHLQRLHMKPKPAHSAMYETLIYSSSKISLMWLRLLPAGIRSAAAYSGKFCRALQDSLHGSSVLVLHLSEVCVSWKLP